MVTLSSRQSTRARCGMRIDMRLDTLRMDMGGAHAWGKCGKCASRAGSKRAVWPFEGATKGRSLAGDKPVTYRHSSHGVVAPSIHSVLPAVRLGHVEVHDSVPTCRRGRQTPHEQQKAHNYGGVALIIPRRCPEPLGLVRTCNVDSDWHSQTCTRSRWRVRLQGHTHPHIPILARLAIHALQAKVLVVRTC